jgi:hypothetical protein
MRSNSGSFWALAARGHELARKTDGEKIDELTIITATLTERHNAVRKELDGLAGLAIKVAFLEQQCNDLRNRAEESSRRRWSLLPALISAVLGGIITLAGQAVIRYFWP